MTLQCIECIDIMAFSNIAGSDTAKSISVSKQTWKPMDIIHCYYNYHVKNQLLESSWCLVQEKAEACVGIVQYYYPIGETLFRSFRAKMGGVQPDGMYNMKKGHACLYTIDLYKTRTRHFVIESCNPMLCTPRKHTKNVWCTEQQALPGGTVDLY